jgi:hypothetical protein
VMPNWLRDVAPDKRPADASSVTARASRRNGADVRFGLMVNFAGETTVKAKVAWLGWEKLQLFETREDCEPRRDANGEGRPWLPTEHAENTEGIWSPRNTPKTRKAD